ncbi:hypothetical protein BGZ80_004689 [Entomortierella chlamydospora]|uniref:Mitochondrial carrier n=1 Tax=Entomortierella chlamydospora TaxID=101097 RepID=A0A9P6SVR0_9FUNG|nr:hypothetical protein BGZ80_004689 [Entomortierella chlamydospora]
MGDHSLSQRPIAASPIITAALSAAGSTEVPQPQSPYVSAISNAPSTESPKQDSGSIQPSTAQRMISACAGSLLTSLLVTPLDVVKTRLQSQTVAATPTCAPPFTYTSDASAYEKLCTCCREVFFAPQTHNPQQQQQLTGVRGIRQNIAKVLASRKRVGSAFSRSQKNRPGHSHDHHHSHNHNHSRTRGTTAGCGPSIIQQHQEGTVIAMKSTRVQQQRLEQLAANCIENNHTSKAAQERHFYGTWDGVKKIVRYEGATSLWRGLSPTVAMSIPATVIYFVGYDHLKDILSEKVFMTSPENDVFLGQSFVYEYRSTLAPLIAGGFARRYESIKRRIVAWDSQHAQPVLNEFGIAFTSGAASGMFAATVTTPFDVAKTRRQVDLTQPTHTRMTSLMKAIVRDEGYRGLWRGLTARVAKVAPSCAIMISSYEVGKKALSEQWWGLGSSSSSSSSSPPSPSPSSTGPSGANAGGNSGGVRGVDDQIAILRDNRQAAL